MSRVILYILDHEKYNLRGRKVLIAAHNPYFIEGQKILLEERGGTVSSCEPTNPRLGDFTRQADVLIAAGRKPCTDIQSRERIAWRRRRVRFGFLRPFPPAFPRQRDPCRGSQKLLQPRGHDRVRRGRFGCQTRQAHHPGNRLPYALPGLPRAGVSKPPPPP